MRKMRTLFLVLLCCGLSLYAGVSYVKAEEKVPSDYDAYLQETGMPENEIQKLDEHVKQFIVDDLKSGDGKFEYMKINAEEQMMNGSAEDFTGIEFYASAFKNGSAIYVYPTMAAASQEEEKEEEAVIDLEPKEEITFEDFGKMQFQVGDIISCDPVKKSKKLLCFQVKVVSQTRQIVSGIKAY